jgi:signal transduction histidine kinase
MPGGQRNAGATVATRPESPGQGREERTVLIVDDEEPMRDSCRQALQREGYRVLTAPDGATALEMVTEEEPDVVLVDLKMPGMPGEDFLLEAREVDPELVAVAITGYPTLSSAVEVMKAGAYDYLPKPFKAEELRIIIQRALQKRRLATQVARGERERNRMRDNFAAMISHQLKSPAACVKECLDSALKVFGDDIPEPCRDLIGRANGKAALLIDLMEDWLTLARVESGELTGEEQAVELGALTEEAVQKALEAPQGNEVSVEVEGADEPLEVRGDRDALREMLFNLLDNARRYTPDGGTATVRLCREGRGGAITVADNGPGIPADELPLIFEPFFRGEQAKSQRHGTGLGLAITRQIAEAHGGRIDVQSTPGSGTTFKVYLPPGDATE